MKYSVLISGEKLRNTNTDEIKELLNRSIKVLLFGYKEILQKYKDLENKFANCLFIYEVLNSSNIPALWIEDGNFDAREVDRIYELGNLCPMFNAEQYEVEHFNIDQTLMVLASAGTGKTTVMVDRIMFLLATVPDLQPEDICMITFTNKAAISMRERLQKKLLDFYKNNFDFKYLQIMEKVNLMQISTIDSFFYDYIRNEGSELGYGQSIKIRSFVYEKKKIIEEVINDLFKNQTGDYLGNNILTINEYVDLSLKYWTFLNQKGYYYSDINKMDFGVAEDESNIINNNLAKIIVESGKRYSKLKKATNSIAIADIRAEMKQLSTLGKSRISKKYKFIFIDEFQDTDNSQIQALAWMRKKMECQLFIVGDIKQSIYRFRGAEETSFSKLEEELLPEKCVKKILRKNYRTSQTILNELNRIFQKWGNAGLLSWDADAVSPFDMEGSVNAISYEKDGKGVAFYGALKECEPLETCVLVRTNREAAEIQQLCFNAKIPHRVVVEGGFFQHNAVLDLLHCIGGLLYSDSPRKLFNFMLTPYSHVRPDVKKLEKFNGDEAKILEYFNDILKEEQWDVLIKETKYMPFFQFVRKIIDSQNPVYGYKLMREKELSDAGFSGSELKAQLRYDVESYSLNLNKLLEIIGNNFGGEQTTLLNVYEYLKNKVNTDIEEDALYFNEYKSDSKVIDIMTVHKAKGLEFDAVIIPGMSRRLTRDFEGSKTKSSEFIVSNDSTEAIKTGWGFSSGNRNSYKNNYFADLQGSEKSAVVREELRILYVALTRAKRKIITLMPYWCSDNCWAHYYSK